MEKGNKVRRQSKRRESVHIPGAEELWDYIGEEGQKAECENEGNPFDKSDVDTLLTTMRVFGATKAWMYQTFYDLQGPPRLRLFDWLGMCVMGRHDDNRQQNAQALRVLVYSWLKTKGEPEAFIQDLRRRDYRIDRSWEKVRLPQCDEPCEFRAQEIEAK